MLSLIEVKCPHCGAQGQIMLPPLGAIIVGPCPECQEMVVVYCGKVLALDKEIMDNGSIIERKEHLMAVLSDFVSDRIDRLLESQAVEAAPDERGEEAREEQQDAPPGMPPINGKLISGANAPKTHMFGENGESPVEGPKISEDEMNAFVNRDLRLIDNKDYFKAVFD